MTRLVLAAMIAAATVSGLANGQTPGRPPRPAVAPARPFQFPKVASHVLSNGLRVLVVEDHSVPVVAVRVVLNADSTLDPRGKEGLFNVMLGSLREGTSSHSAEELAEASALIGTAVSPTSFSTMSSSFGTALRLMGDMLMHPALEQAGVDRRKASQAARARSELQKPSAPGRNLIYAMLYGRDDAVTRSLYASEASAGAVTREDVLQAYHQYIGPRTATIIVTGDVSDASALAEVRSVFGGWSQPADVPHFETAAVALTKPTTIYLHDVPGNAVYVYYANVGPARSAPDHLAFETMGTVSANRLIQAVREKHPFAYASTSGPLWHRLPRVSEFLGGTSVNSAKTDSAMTVWLDMLRGLRGAETPTVAEMEAARRIRIGTLPVRIEGPDQVADRLVELVRDALPVDYYNQYAAGISATSAADVSAAASRYVDLDHLVIVVTGDRKVVEPKLRASNIAPVVVVDANGKVIP